ncbi:DNA-3-methyladenine glycosylase family protein [Bordetella genomosp. 9]|uniref:DNA-3-methyladenine glycosylase II n=1 Tax=Bordetella genomosp. 9 TaxID=1416803 RepID=A0A1W6Z2Q0_9BORD|nr:DNA-3-methyladenine glycosylase [Bordetella genomosp. 9]ARP87454.1 DNA-3-methyladenine glycosylase [Bordetella genomosp. 9]ARP91438.1 DNA-3-methyladenine glycosylase [Bordetella genomosp. 9]
MSSDIAVSKPPYWEDAVAHLVRRDRILKKLIPQHPEVWLKPRGTPFVTLARSIIGQQISTRAAEAVWQRFLQAAGSRPSPASVLRVGVQGLREAGLSQRKAEYVQDLARHFSERKVHPERWSSMDDEAVIEELVAIRGIGRWTAEMFLIFNLQRPDVLPLDDLGLLKAISLHYFSGEPVSRFEAREVSLAWQPWRTVATWYLWHSLEPLAV